MNQNTTLIISTISALTLCAAFVFGFLNSKIEPNTIKTIVYAIMIIGVSACMIITKLKVKDKGFRILSYMIYLAMIVAFLGKIFISLDIWDFILWLICFIGLFFLLFLCAKAYLQGKNMALTVGPALALVVSALVIMTDTSAFSYENNDSTTWLFIIWGVLFLVTLVLFALFKKTFCKVFVTTTNKMLACLGAFLISGALSFISIPVFNQSFVFEYQLQNYTIVDMKAEPSGKYINYSLIIQNGTTQKSLGVSKEDYNSFYAGIDINLRYYQGTLGLNYYKYYTSDNVQ